MIGSKLPIPLPASSAVLGKFLNSSKVSPIPPSGNFPSSAVRKNFQRGCNWEVLSSFTDGMVVLAGGRVGMSLPFGVWVESGVGECRTGGRLYCAARLIGLDLLARGATPLSVVRSGEVDSCSGSRRCEFSGGMVRVWWWLCTSWGL